MAEFYVGLRPSATTSLQKLPALIAASREQYVTLQANRAGDRDRNCLEIPIALKMPGNPGRAAYDVLMDGATQASICNQCGSSVQADTIFCKTCGATLRPTLPLIAPAAPQISVKLPIWKRIARGLIKTIAAVAELIIIFDNRAAGLAGILLIGSAAVVLLCFLGWRFLDLGDDKVFRPKKANS
jgi:hypothetical protein